MPIFYTQIVTNTEKSGDENCQAEGVVSRGTFRIKLNVGKMTVLLVIFLQNSYFRCYRKNIRLLWQVELKNFATDECYGSLESNL
jgi:hypothetical protein